MKKNRPKQHKAMDSEAIRPYQSAIPEALPRLVEASAELFSALQKNHALLAQYIRFCIPNQPDFHGLADYTDNGHVAISFQEGAHGYWQCRHFNEGIINSDHYLCNTHFFYTLFQEGRSLQREEILFYQQIPHWEHKLLPCFRHFRPGYPDWIPTPSAQELLAQLCEGMVAALTQNPRISLEEEQQLVCSYTTEGWDFSKAVIPEIPDTPDWEPPVLDWDRHRHIRLQCKPSPHAVWKVGLNPLAGTYVSGSDGSDGSDAYVPWQGFVQDVLTKEYRLDTCTHKQRGKLIQDLLLSWMEEKKQIPSLVQYLDSESWNVVYDIAEDLGFDIDEA